MKTISLFALFIVTSFSIFAQNKTAYPDIRWIDVHAHPANDYVALRNHIRLREILSVDFDVDFAFWTNSVLNINTASTVFYNFLVQRVDY